ncbi:unnamed protein product [Oikopleura dioica]|uniref:Guanine deaminase n=1 Tax=Oikopleura dioica TaxID=34765 RepID=E4X687_OIKDI|nr:unnamed protein product [Oikopleura dioica]
MAAEGDRIFVGKIVVGTDPNEELTKNDWAIVVDSHGIIKASGSSEHILSRFDGEIVKLGPYSILMPGFIDAHLHAPQFGNIGTHQDLPLLDWLTNYTFPIESKFSDKNFSEKMNAAVVRSTLSRGTTTACYFGTIYKDDAVALATQCAEQGQRAYVGKVNMDINPLATYYLEKSAESVVDTAWAAREIRGLGNSLVEPIITPRFAPSCSVSLMQSLGKMAKEQDMAIQTHISENEGEIQLMKERFPNDGYLDVYEKNGLVSDRCLLAHSIYLTESEKKKMAEKGASIVHCPDSNFALMSGVLDHQSATEANINVALGTDVAGGASASMVDAMRYAELASKINTINQKQTTSYLNFKKPFIYGTLNGAKALKIDDKTGSLEVGKEFDAVIADVSASLEPVFLDNDSPDELLERFVHCSDPRSITNVFVRGKQVFSS